MSRSTESKRERPLLVVAPRGCASAVERVPSAGARELVVRACEDLPHGDRAATAALAAELARLELADVLGIGSGSPLALLLACTSSSIAACATIGGALVFPRLSAEHPIQPLELALNLACPLVVLHGADDPEFPRAHVDLARAKLAQFARDAAFHAVPGAAAGWCDPASSGYRAALVKSAVERALAELATAHG